MGLVVTEGLRVPVQRMVEEDDLVLGERDVVDHAIDRLMELPEVVFGHPSKGRPTENRGKTPSLDGIGMKRIAERHVEQQQSRVHGGGVMKLRKIRNRSLRSAKL